METLAERQNTPETRVINEYERRYNDVTTLAAEMLDGSMQTSFEYEFDGQELYASDGSSIGEIFETAQADAYKIAKKDPRLACEIRRRGEDCELGEYKDMKAMASGQGPNTMIVTSDAPAELDEWGEDVGGYNFKRKQTMLRVITRLPNGNIQVTSQTLDRSDREGLEKIHEFFGQKPQPGELLGQRIKVDVEPERQELLTGELTREYDRALEEKFGGRYYAGRTPADRDNTYSFVRDQDDLVHQFIQNDQNDGNLLGLIAALENRWNMSKSNLGDTKAHFLKLFDGISPQHEIQFMADWASEQGKTYSGCGVTISGKNEIEALGYGNKVNSGSDEDCEFVSRECPECGEKDVKTKVTKHKITGDCGCSVSK